MTRFTRLKILNVCLFIVAFQFHTQREAIKKTMHENHPLTKKNYIAANNRGLGMTLHLRLFLQFISCDYHSVVIDARISLCAH
jgi:hypothetical protein